MHEFIHVLPCLPGMELRMFPKASRQLQPAADRMVQCYIVWRLRTEISFHHQHALQPETNCCDCMTSRRVYCHAAQDYCCLAGI